MPMNRTYKHPSYIYPLFLAITSVTGIFTIINNLELNKYQMDRDSVGLPISIIIIIWAVLTLAHMIQIVILKNKSTRNHTGLLINIPIYLIAASSLLILANRTIYWAVPDHAVISILYGACTIVFMDFQLRTLAQLK